MTTKKNLALLFAFLIMLTLSVPAAAVENEIITGRCGEDATWTLTPYGILTISGEGEMYDWYYGYPGQSYLPKWSASSLNPVRQVIIEEGITSIGDFAFAFCSALTKVSIPDSVVSIGHAAFYQCTGLRHIELPSSIKGMGIDIFRGCSKLSSITLPDGLEGLPAYFLYGCVSLRSIYLPDSMIAIGEYALANCTGLTYLDLPDKITRLYNGCFQNCTNLAVLNLPEKLEIMESDLFQGCSSLVTLKIPASVQSLAHTFENATALKSIYFLGNSPSCGSEAFLSVTATVYYPENNLSWTPHYREKYGSEINWVPYKADIAYDPVIASGTISDTMSWTLKDNYILTISGAGDMITVPREWHDYAERVEHIVIEPGVNSIAPNAFYDFRSLQSVSIADTVTKIGHGAFRNCTMLPELEIPDGVTEIELDAFGGCISMESLTFRGSFCLDTEQLYFREIETSVYYPAEDASWSEDVRLDYGGTITWVPFSAVSVLPGDADDSGNVDYMDAMLVLRMAVQLNPLPREIDIIDMDNNNAIDYMDAMKILRIAVGLDL